MLIEGRNYTLLRLNVQIEITFMLNLLPIDHFIPTILDLLANEANLVITAAPGAGKTTRLPPALLSAAPGKILVLEPRRMAAIAAAHRIAEENNWKVSEEVGFQVRFNNKTSKNTRLIFMTEALLARQMIQDPELQNVDIVILDEFHERSLHVDLTLGLIRELQELGRKIKIIVMSATLEAEKISRYLLDAPIISVPGKLFPLDIRYQKTSQQLKTLQPFYETLFQLVKEAQQKTVKDILIFLPGIAEIEKTKSILLAWADTKNIKLVTLHGSLSVEAQRQVLQKSSIQRIILSTNIAESSVTLDGVDTVIDSGLVKIMKLDLRTGFSRLELSRISLSSAIQRGGRAARQFPGINYRMWTPQDEINFSKSETPEILRSDLSESLLFLAAQGIQQFDKFSWFEKPAAVNIEYALRQLKSTNALDSHNKLTELGKHILHFPLPVRLSRLLITGIEYGCVELAAKIAALLQERDILRKNMASEFLGDKFECDLSVRLEILNQNGNSLALQNVMQSYRHILHLAKHYKSNKQPLDENEARQLLLMLSYSDRLCRRRKNSDRGLMVGGRGVRLSNESLVATSEFFVSLNGMEVASDAETVVNMASGIQKEFIFKYLSDHITNKTEIIFNEEKKKFYRQEFKSLWDLPIEEPILALATPKEVAEKLPEILATNWSMVLASNSDLMHWWQKILFLREQQAVLSPEIQAELAQLFDGELFNKPFCHDIFMQACLGENNIDTVVKKNLVYFFENNLSLNLKKILRDELPCQIKVPSGRLIPLHYTQGKPPYLEIRIQEIFGWKETPRILFNSISIVLHLLAPNFRPVQITNNLESFWQHGYAEVRKELRIRYPKHQWPEDPADGHAEAKGRRR